MQLSDQICSLELAKKLRDLGVKQESYFYWINPYLDKWNLFHAENDDCDQHSGPGHITWLSMLKQDNKAFSAFTVAELGKFLPPKLIIGEQPMWLTMAIDRQVYYASNDFKEEYWNFDMEDNDSEAESRAKMIAHLLHYKLMEAPK